MQQEHKTFVTGAAKIHAFGCDFSFSDPVGSEMDKVSIQRWAVRAEDIVGVSFFGLLFPAIGIAISGSSSALTPRLQALRRGWGLSLCGLALILFGLLNFQFIHNSPRPVVEGNLWDIRASSFRSNSSTQFRVTDATGQAVVIRCRYYGPGFQEGERARVRYVAYNRKLLEMDMLTGPYGAWHLRESSGEYGFLAWAAIGLICGFAGYRQFGKAAHKPSAQ